MKVFLKNFFLVFLVLFLCSSVKARAVDFNGSYDFTSVKNFEKDFSPLKYSEFSIVPASEHSKYIESAWAFFQASEGGFDWEKERLAKAKLMPSVFVSLTEYDSSVSVYFYLFEGSVNFVRRSSDAEELVSDKACLNYQFSTSVNKSTLTSSGISITPLTNNSITAYVPYKKYDPKLYSFALAKSAGSNSLTIKGKDIPFSSIGEDIPNFEFANGIRIANYKEGMEVKPFSSAGNKYIDVTLYGKNKVNGLDWALTSWSKLQKIITDNMEFNLGGNIVKGLKPFYFEFVDKDNALNPPNPDNPDDTIKMYTYKFKCVYRIPYPNTVNFLDYMQVSTKLGESTIIAPSQSRITAVEYTHKVEKLKYWFQGDIEEVPDYSDLAGAKEYTDILNMADGSSVYFNNSSVKSKVFLTNNPIAYGQTYVDKNIITATDDDIKSNLVKDVEFYVDNNLVGNVNVIDFDWIVPPSKIKALDKQTKDDVIKWKLTLKVPYPFQAKKGSAVKVIIPAYQGSMYGYNQLTDDIGNIEFKSIDDAGEGGEGGGGGGDIIPPTIPPFPELPPFGGGEIGKWADYLVEVVTWFFKILIWTVTRPFVFLFDCITTLATYITTMVSSMGDVGKDIANVMSWLPTDITNVIFGMFSLIIIFCSIKLFKNFSGK